jgi:hypothetical protein
LLLQIHSLLNFESGSEHLLSIQSSSPQQAILSSPFQPNDAEEFLKSPKKKNKGKKRNNQSQK